VRRKSIVDNGRRLSSKCEAAWKRNRRSFSRTGPGWMVRAADLSVAGLARDAVKLLVGCRAERDAAVRAKLVFQLTPEGEIRPARFIQLESPCDFAGERCLAEPDSVINSF
jgi:hypothetical protein